MDEPAHSTLLADAVQTTLPRGWGFTSGGRTP